MWCAHYMPPPHRMQRARENAMPFIPTPNGISVVLKATQNGIPIVNVFHVDNGGTPTTTDLTDVATVFFDWWQAWMQPNIHTSYVLSEIVAKDISIINGSESIINLTTDNAGTGLGVAAAANAAVVISWRTALTGRSYRGRTYVGGLPQAWLTSAQNISVEAASAFADAFQELIDALTVAGKVLCVLSKFALGVARTIGVLTEIISLIVDTKVDSQRRRTAN